MSKYIVVGIAALLVNLFLLPVTMNLLYWLCGEWGWK